ncbi:MAG: Fumarate reductase flavoprotein subunit [candidate division WS2 bacterium]|nr:Fumarate reductase flavoprotein subunit [Candidatus Psychracetigena formicireducens]
MNYPANIYESIKIVEKTRPMRAKEKFPLLSPDDKQALLNSFHPDFREDTLRALKVGASKGFKVPHEVANLLESRSRLNPADINLNTPDYEVDVLIIGGGGAGAAAALMAQAEGASVIITTKLRLGDANTMMAQGGIQAATKENDTPLLHYLDMLGGGGFQNKPDLVELLVKEAPLVMSWLESLGCMFDKDKDGIFATIHGGGTCRKRMHFARDYTGAEIMRTLRDEVRNRRIEVIEFAPAIELLLDDDGQCAGAVLMNLERGTYQVVKAKTTILSTGGFGRLHVGGFPTSNHYGATADGLVMAYRVGVKLVFMEATQFHPTGAAYPEQIVGLLVTEKVRGVGAQLVNALGEQFIYPLETRDVVSSGIIKECYARERGVTTPTGMKGVWLDSPLIDFIHGTGTVAKELPAMVRQYERYGIDIAKEPILIYPTLHYQNGGIEINPNCETIIPNLYASGEVSGGIHGRNRLMGNSLMDVLVFGRKAGLAAARKSKGIKIGPLNLNHLGLYEKELELVGVKTELVSPLLLPDYTPDIRHGGGIE